MIKNIQSSVNLFTGSVWDRVNFFHSNPYGAVFQICHQNNIDNTPMFQLSLSGAWTTPRSLFGTLSPEARRLEVCWWARDWEGAQLSQTDQRDIPYHIRSRSAMKGGRASFFQSCLCPQASWTPVCCYEVVSDYLCIIWNLFGLFFHLLSCLYTNPWVFITFALLILFSIPLWRSETDWVQALPPAEVNPLQPPWPLLEMEK